MHMKKTVAAIALPVAFDATGTLVPASSKCIVNVGALKSDRDRRDGYVRGRILFSDFGLNQPRVPVVLSVADSIKLEYTFSLVPKT